ncbi:MAG: helix-turn-helix transcriptional regulator [Spirochaetota bacterium]
MHRRSCWVAYQSLVAGIRARRRELRVSQEALGSMAGLHRNTVRLLESGQTDATLLTVVRVLAALGVTRIELEGRLVNASFAAGGPEAPTRVSEGFATWVSDGPAVLERFGRSIAERRREAGLTQERLAERTGLHPHTIGEIERGLEDPTVSTVLALYETLGVHELAPAPEGLALS